MAALAISLGEAKPNESFLSPDGELILQGGADEEEAPVLVEKEEEASPMEGLEEEIGGSPVGLFDTEDLKSEEAEVSKKFSLANLQPVKLDSAPPPPPADDAPIIAAPIPTPTAAPEPVVAPAAAEGTPKAEPSPLKKGPRSVEPVLGGPLANPVPPPQAPVKPTMMTSGIAAYYLEKLRNQNQSTFDLHVNASLQQLKPFFKKAMILAVGDKDSFVKPLVWDKDFENQKPQSVEFNIKTPCIFKVVSGTQKPYHGYVIVNDLNESFFEAWNQGQVPDHVTIVPLLDGENVVGMLMGIGEKSSYNKNVLHFTEDIAKDLSKKILKNPPQEKAA